MSDDYEDKMVMIGDEIGPLSAIADFDMSDVEERRISALPVGAYRLRCGEAKLDSIDGMKDGLATKRAAVIFTYKVIMVHKITDNEWPKDKDIAELVDKEHRETFFIRTPEDLGYIKAFVSDHGIALTGKLGEGLAQMAGREIDTFITRRADKNDSSKTYTNINRQKIKPV